MLDLDLGFLDIIALVLLLFLASGCSHSMIVKECSAKAEGTDFFICKNLKPWE